MDLLARLSSEHEQLRTHLRRVEAAALERNDGALIEAIGACGSALTTHLDAHITLEESEAFTAIAAALGEDVIAHFRDEHHEIKALRDSLLAATGRHEAPHAMALSLCDLLLNHQQREDGILFPSIRDILPEHQLQDSE